MSFIPLHRLVNLIKNLCTDTETQVALLKKKEKKVSLLRGVAALGRLLVLSFFSAFYLHIPAAHLMPLSQKLIEVATQRCGGWLGCTLGLSPGGLSVTCYVYKHKKSD